MPNTLFFVVITDINVMVAESTGVAQVEDFVASTSTEDSVIKASASEPSVVEFAVALVAVKTTTISAPEVLAMISVSKETVVGLIPARVELAPVSVDITRTIIER